MRILMVIGQFYPTIGGAERQCLALSRALVCAGHAVTVVTTWYDHHLPHTETIDGIRVYRVWYPLFSVGTRRIGLGFFAPFFMTVALCREGGACDIIHAHQALWPAFAATVAARFTRKPALCKIGNSGVRFDLLQLRRGHWYGKFAAWFLKRTMSKFVWTSAAVCDDLKKDGIAEKQLVYIPNGVDVPILHGEAPRPRDRKTHFIFTGTFTFKKNLLLLLDAVSLLIPTLKAQMHLVLLGDGPDRAALLQAIRERHLHDVVAIEGPVADVRSALLASDVFVLPSHTEGLSNSALEAMAHRLALILSDAGGNRDLVRTTKGEINGILIDHHSPQSLAEAMQYMVDHPEDRKRMGECSRRYIEKRYAMDKVMNDYVALYHSLI